MSVARQLLSDITARVHQLSRLLKGKESDAAHTLPSKPRTIQEVQNEYNRVCISIGHESVQISKSEANIAQLKARAATLGAEAEAITQATEKAKH